MIRRGTLRRGGVKWKNWAWGALATLGLASISAKPVNSWVSRRQPSAVSLANSSAYANSTASLANSSNANSTVSDENKGLYDLIIQTNTVLTFNVKDPRNVLRKVESSGIKYKFNEETNYYEFFLKSSINKHAYAKILLDNENMMLSLHEPAYSQIDLLLVVLLSSAASFVVGAVAVSRMQRRNLNAGLRRLEAEVAALEGEEYEEYEDGEEAVGPPQGGHKRKTHKRRYSTNS